MRRAARMQQRARLRQLAHQQPGAAGVIEVHVGEQQVVDRLTGDAELGECAEQQGDRRVGPDVDECRAAFIHDEVRGGVSRVQVLGVDGTDAVGVSVDARLQGNVGLTGTLMYTS